eukprot:3260452-Rhodomonas_salina.2
MESRTFGVSSQYQNRTPWEKNPRPSLAKKGQQHILGSSHDVVRNEVVNENVLIWFAGLMGHSKAAQLRVDREINTRSLSRPSREADHVVGEKELIEKHGLSPDIGRSRKFTGGCRIRSQTACAI